MRTIETVSTERTFYKAKTKELFHQILPLEQELFKLKEEYRQACLAFDKTDRELAALDGRLKVIEPLKAARPARTAVVTETQALAYLQGLSPDALDAIIGRLENQLS